MVFLMLLLSLSFCIEKNVFLQSETLKYLDNLKYRFMISRFFKIEDTETESVLFFGARQSGKTTLLKQLFPNVRYYDLLKSDEFERLGRTPSLLPCSPDCV